MNLRGHVEIVFPGLWWLQAGTVKNVLAVIDHLEVAIDHKKLGLAADLLAELAEIRRDIIKVDLVVLGDIRIEILKQAGRVKLDAPTGSKDADINRVGAGRPVTLDLRENFCVRHLGNDDLRPGGLLEFNTALDQTAGDDVTRTGQDVDGDPVKLARRGNRGRADQRQGTGGQSQQTLANSHLQFLP